MRARALTLGKDLAKGTSARETPTHAGFEGRGGDVASGAREVAMVGEDVESGAGRSEVGGLRCGVGARFESREIG